MTHGWRPTGRTWAEAWTAEPDDAHRRRKLDIAIDHVAVVPVTVPNTINERAAIFWNDTPEP